MKISAIVAMDRKRVIGYQNRLPWHLPADLQHFKRITWQRSIIMGRKTHESIGKALPQRRNLIVSRNAAYVSSSCEVFATIDDAINACGDENEIFIIGGASIFAAALPRIEKIYLTLIEHAFLGDTYFPLMDESAWQTTVDIFHQADEKNPYPYHFMERVRR